MRLISIWLLAGCLYAQTVCTNPNGCSGTGGGSGNATSVNGAAVPASQSCLGTNASAQLVAGTCTGSGLPDPGSNGIVVRTGAGADTARSMTAGTGISVANADGTAGNPTITNTTVTGAQTFYVCAKANGSTCGSTDPSNGWHNNATASPTIADSNNCTAVATPCASLAGVEAKIHNQALTGLVTVYLADTANTGTDCYAPNAVTFNNPSNTSRAGTGKENSVTLSYPANYLYIYGNPTTPANVTLAGNGCNVSATVGNHSAIALVNRTIARINGIQTEGFGLTNAFGWPGTVVIQDGSIGYVENYTWLGDTSGGSSISSGVTVIGTGVMVMGGTWSLTNGTNGVDAVQGGTVYTYGPADSSSANTSVSASGQGNGTFMANENGTIWTDRLTYNLTGSTASPFLNAYLGGRIIYAEIYMASDCPSSACLNGTVNNANLIYQQAAEGGFIDSDCSTGLEQLCTATQQPAAHSSVATGGFAREYATASGNTQVITASDTLNPGGCVSTFVTGGASEIYHCGKAYFNNAEASQFTNDQSTQNVMDLSYNGQLNVRVTSAGASTFQGNSFNGQRAEGTVSSPSAISQSGDMLIGFNGTGYDGTAYQRGANFLLETTGAWNSSSRPSQVRFQTVASGSTVPTDRLIIGPSGGVQIKATTVASLPTCNSSLEGTLYPVTDANSATFNATASGGGANHVIAYCNGTSWTIH